LGRKRHPDYPKFHLKSDALILVCQTRDRKGRQVYHERNKTAEFSLDGFENVQGRAGKIDSTFCPEQPLRGEIPGDGNLVHGDAFQLQALASESSLGRLEIVAIIQYGITPASISHEFEIGIYLG
jgi:hypothetical protein